MKAGTWYTYSQPALNAELKEWLSKTPSPERNARAVIVPHAGHRYCGRTAGAAYCRLPLDDGQVKRVFLLGPSHHEALSAIALTSCTAYDTPLGQLAVDTAVVGELLATGLFTRMPRGVDEEEHSLELQLPFLAHLSGCAVPIVPMLVDHPSPRKLAEYGRALAPYLADPANLFVISSDFCHWGSRFAYTRVLGGCPIWESIQTLDRCGMDAITSLDPKQFADYLANTGNTICGRFPILVLLHTVAALPDDQRARMQCNFVDYSQSSKCMALSDSSVSYAAGVFTCE